MKKLNFNLLTVLLSVLMLTFVTSCNDDGDDPKPVSKTPVLNENFSFVVTGNDVVFTTTLTGSVWFTNVTAVTDYNAVDGTVTVNIPLKGSYPFTCSALVDGQTYTSDEFTVAIENDDFTFLSDGIWKALTGGSGGNKVWVLDIEKKFFHAIADYYGDEDAGATGQNAWGPWGGGYVSEYDLGGEISFNGEEGTVLLKFNGETKNGSFTFETFDRPAAADYLNYGSGVTTYDLWNDGFVNGPYKYLPLSEQMGTMHLSEGLHFPLDSARFYNDAIKGLNTVNPSQFLEEDLRNCDIVHLSDSAMVVRIKRSFEGDNDNKCWMLYNFIVKGYEYAKEEFTYTEPIKTSFTQADLVGTWKYANMPQGWIAWAAAGNKGTNIPAHMFGMWDTREQVVTDLVSWGAADAADVFTANENNTYVFNQDGTCTLNGVANTYTVANGIITFGTALAGTEWSLVWISMTGTELKAIDFAFYGDPEPVAYTPLGLWIGQQNDAKNEYKAVQLVKQ